MTKKLGRPPVIGWSHFHSWRTKTNTQIAKELECSTTNVYLKRQKLIREAEEKGKNPKKYICKFPRWSRGKTSQAC